MSSNALPQEELFHLSQKAMKDCHLTDLYFLIVVLSPNYLLTQLLWLTVASKCCFESPLTNPSGSFRLALRLQALKHAHKLMWIFSEVHNISKLLIFSLTFQSCLSLCHHDILLINGGSKAVSAAQTITTSSRLSFGVRGTTD